MKSRIKTILLGYAIVVLFTLVSILLFRNGADWLGLASPPPQATVFTISALLALPLALPFLWERLTKVKLPWIEMELSDVTANVQTALVEELDKAEGLAMAHSGVDKIEQAVEIAATAGIVEVDIGVGESWLKTRLFLLSALAQEFTSIRQIVFLEHKNQLDRVFLGSASVLAVRQALSNEQPHLEIALEEAKRQGANRAHTTTMAERAASIARDYDPAPDPNMEADNRSIWVTRQWLCRTHCLTTNSIEWDEGSPKPWLLDKVVNASDDFVPLVKRNGQLNTVLDRFKTAERIAKVYMHHRFS